MMIISLFIYVFRWHPSEHVGYRVRTMWQEIAGSEAGGERRYARVKKGKQEINGENFKFKVWIDLENDY